MDPVVTFLLETLKGEIVTTSKKLSGVKDQIKILHDDLIYYKGVLESWTRNPIESNAEKALVKQLREAVYDAEDILADFVAEETNYKNKNFLRKMAHSSDHASKLLSAAKNIKSMREKVERMHERRMTSSIFDANQEGQGAPSRKKPRTVPTVEEENVVGFDGEAETVIGLLTQGREDLEVITIIGMPGLGKTTLAKMIYRNHQIEYEFYNRVWVYVSRDCNVREVFLQILGGLQINVTNEMHEMEIDKLSEEVKNNLEREKYLIVMDDVWEPKDWINLEKAFPKNKKNSRILITSRNESVAKRANPLRGAHKLKFLTPDESFELLNIKALGLRKCPSDLQRPGWQIAQECHGLPLAIVVIGGILREQGAESGHWIDVSENVKAYINMDPEKKMTNLIAWSFYQLPYPLKACFLYFGMFPEDSHISASKLIRMWIAEGFIQQTPGIILEKIAERNLEDLVKRNLVIVGDWSSYGKIKTCHIHDMIRAFCVEMATEENLYHEVKQFDPRTYISSNPEIHKYRRICIHSQVVNYLNSKDSISPNIRSLLCSSTEDITLQTAQVSYISRTFKLLRVLDNNSIAFQAIPKDLNQLVLLRYLVLSIKLKTLPDAISKLSNLQSLMVHTTSRTLEIKGDLLLQLRHLETNSSTSWLALSKGKDKTEQQLLKNENLTTLSTISPETCTKVASDRVPNITKLGIRGQLAKILNGGDTSCSFKHLSNLKMVKILKLYNDVLDVTYAEGEIARIPAKGFPPNLKKLTLTNTQLDWSHMSTLGKLENLEILKLKDNAFKGKYWDSKAGEFRALKVLLVGRTDLASWQTSGDHFPKLKRLSLHHCTYLIGVPSALADFPSLQTVDLFWTTLSAASLAKTIRRQSGKDFKLSIYPPEHDK